MSIPASTHPGWAAVVRGERAPEFEFLATKILVGRLTLAYKLDPSPETEARAIEELREFFEKNHHIPKVQADLEGITGAEDENH